jgi:hypothetical protein
MTLQKLATFTDDLPAHDDPIIAHEPTDYGWRGLSAKGELVEVRSSNGRKAMVPEGDTIVVRGNVATSRRAINNNSDLNIGEYLQHFDRASALTRANRHAEALIEVDAAIALAPTLFARLNRALLLLALNRWREGFGEYRACEEDPRLMRPAMAEALAAGLKPWNGEDLAGKRLLLLHAHGFGDSIMSLRYVPALQAMGATVALKVPKELEKLAAQVAPVADELLDADFFCPLLYLVGMVERPWCISPCLCIDAEAVARRRASRGLGWQIGVAWSPSVVSDFDYPRTIPLGSLADALRGSELHSVQKQGADEARACGVHAYDFEDFADCAALMLAMDQIVSIDTAALHLAGAIRHPRVDGLLSHWSSWRWLAPWYANVRLCRQTSPDDWDSALNQLDAS